MSPIGGSFSGQMTSQSKSGLPDYLKVTSSYGAAGTAPIDWNALTNIVGNAQNMSFCNSQLAGNALVNGASNTAANTVGSAAADLGGALGGITGNPFIGTLTGALAGGLVGNAASNWAGQQATKIAASMNLRPVQSFLGGVLSQVNKARDTFGFLLPSNDTPDISYLGRITTINSDANIKYATTPYLPTLTHQGVRWRATKESPVLGFRGGDAMSRMSFSIEARNLVMSLLINPKSVSISRSTSMSMAASRSGFIVNPTGPVEFDVTVSGTTAGFYNSKKMLTSRETVTVAYSNLLMLYNFFLNNGYLMDDEKSNSSSKSSSGVVSTRMETPASQGSEIPQRRINSMCYVAIDWQRWKWWGFFKSFKIHDVAENPYTLNYEFTFRVCHESDQFKIDNVASKHATPPVTGHVPRGYSPERSLAMKSVGKSDTMAAGANTPTHANAALPYSFDDDSNHVAIALDPRRTVQESTTRLTLGGYTLNLQMGDSGPRAWGTGPDGTAIDINARDNQREVTVVSPGGSPVKYISVAEQASPGVIQGTIKVAPGETCTYSTPGTLAISPNAGR